MSSHRDFAGAPSIFPEVDNVGHHLLDVLGHGRVGVVGAEVQDLLHQLVQFGRRALLRQGLLVGLEGLAANLRERMGGWNREIRVERLKRGMLMYDAHLHGLGDGLIVLLVLIPCPHLREDVDDGFGQVGVPLGLVLVLLLHLEVHEQLGVEERVRAQLGVAQQILGRVRGKVRLLQLGGPCAEAASEVVPGGVGGHATQQLGAGRTEGDIAQALGDEVVNEGLAGKV